MNRFRWAVLNGLRVPSHIMVEIPRTELRQNSDTLNFEGIKTGKRMPQTGINDVEKERRIQ